jgi:50S ribosomal subunit-associated GTPase HflX
MQEQIEEIKQLLEQFINNSKELLQAYNKFDVEQTKNNDFKI